MTIKEMRAALDQLGPGHDNTEVQVWLPGTYIELRQVFTVGVKGKILIEGNVASGEI
jgi:hypothetical protein